MQHPPNPTEPESKRPAWLTSAAVALGIGILAWVLSGGKLLLIIVAFPLIPLLNKFFRK